MMYFRRIFPIFNTIIPNTLTNELSYYEDICKLNQKIDEIIKALQGLDDEIELIIEDHLRPVYSYIDSKDEELKNEIIEAEYRLSNAILKLNELLQYEYSNLNLKLENEIKKLYLYISNLQIEGFLMFNPTNGLVENVKKVIFDIYEKLRYHAIRAYWYDTKGLTADEFEALNLTASEYDLYGKDHIQIDYYHNAFNYKTGKFDSVQRFLYMLIQEVRPDAMTTTVYDNLELTAGYFDNMENTAIYLDTETIGG